MHMLSQFAFTSWRLYWYIALLLSILLSATASTHAITYPLQHQIDAAESSAIFKDNGTLIHVHRYTGGVREHPQVLQVARGSSRHLQQVQMAGTKSSAQPWWRIHSSYGNIDASKISTRTMQDPPTDNGKYVSYRPREGFNNQRQSLSMAFFVAFVLNRTLLVPPVTHSLHDSGRGSQAISSYFNLSALQQVVPVVLRNASNNKYFEQQTHMELEYCPELHANISSEAIQKSYEMSESRILYLNRRMYWVYLRHFLDENSYLVARSLIMHNLHYTDQIFEDAMMLRQRIMSLASVRGNVTGLSMCCEY